MTFRIESNYRQTQLRLKTVNPLAAKQLRMTEKALAEPIAAAARARASWSKSIPPAIKATATGTFAGIRVSAKRSRLAVIEERAKGSFRHPLFGNREHWYSQTARPSVKPVVHAARPAAEAAMRVAVREAAREAGFR